jgi:hypothetical protein
MTSRKLLVICLLAAACTGASASDAQNQQGARSFSTDSQSVSAVNSPAATLPKPGKHGGNPTLRSSLSSIKGGVVKEMRATSTFVQQEAANPGAHDDWLIVLAALGLIVLQLRRKHNSLPQRRIAPYG